MQKILNQKHNKHTFTFASSKLLERTAYYGIRSLLVLYMVKASLSIPEEEALQIYGWFTSAVIFAQILGAVLGDLILGSKRAVIVGGLTQAIGAFVLCIPS
ncbi:MAG: MFS transporter, partial [Bacteroidetes bacterium]|nr:MFS transporter [Bacteroidota bacterium]